MHVQSLFGIDAPLLADMVQHQIDAIDQRFFLESFRRIVEYPAVVAAVGVDRLVHSRFLSVGVADSKSEHGSTKNECIPRNTSWLECETCSIT